MLFGFLPLAVLPEFLLGFGILLILVTGSFVKKHLLVWSQSVFLLIFLLAILWGIDVTHAKLFGDIHWVYDPMARLLKTASVFALIMVLVYSKSWVEQDKYLSYESIVLMLIALLGAWVVISAQHVLTLFVGVELLSLPLYALVAIRSKAQDAAAISGSEAALKYFITGSMASACLLFGLSLLFGVTGHMDYSGLLVAISHIADQHYHGMVISMVLIVVSMAFKFGLFPFHMWVPDVYQGSPLSVTFLIATLPKIALVALSLRLFGGVFVNTAAIWQPLLLCLGVASIVYGNFVALFQTNLPRLLGYSSIAHMGVLVLALALVNQDAWQAAIFYILVYVLTSGLLFGGLLQLRSMGERCDNIKDLAGLSSVYSGIALVFLLAIFSLAGVPPVVGFIAKFSILNVLLTYNYTSIAVVTVLMACVGCFYYIRLIKVIYFDKNTSNELINCATKPINALLSMHGLLVVAIGVMPYLLIKYCNIY